MRYRSAGSVKQGIVVHDSWVVGNDYHMDSSGLDVFSDGCHFYTSLNEFASRMEEASSVTVVESRPEEIAPLFADLVKAWSVQPDLRVAALVPRGSMYSMLEYLDLQPYSQELALVGIQIDSSRALLSFSPIRHGDGSLAEFLEGFRLGETMAEPAAIVIRETNCVDPRNLESKLLGVLEAISDMRPLEADEPMAEETLVCDSVEQAELDALLNKITKVTTERDALQRKYDSLASSMLGRATLRYWNWRRKAK